MTLPKKDGLYWAQWRIAVEPYGGKPTMTNDILDRIRDAAETGHKMWKAGHDQCKADLRRRIKLATDAAPSDTLAQAEAIIEAVNRFIA
jgi:hypothetical protein